MSSPLPPVLAFILVKPSFSFCLILPLRTSSCFRCCLWADEGSTFSFAGLKPGRAMLISWKSLWYSQAQDMAMCHLYWFGFIHLLATFWARWSQTSGLFLLQGTLLNTNWKMAVFQSEPDDVIKTVVLPWKCPRNGIRILEKFLESISLHHKAFHLLLKAACLLIAKLPTFSLGWHWPHWYPKNLEAC